MRRNSSELAKDGTGHALLSANKDRANITIDPTIGHISLGICAISDGRLDPALGVFQHSPGLQENIVVRTSFKDFFQARSSKGSVNGEIFEEYVRIALIPWLRDNYPDQQVVLFLDGCTSHFSETVPYYLNQAGIKLAKLVPHSTHATQPVDDSIGVTWKTRSFSFLVSTIPSVLQKLTPGAVMLAFSQTMKDVEGETVINSFRTTGMHPFNPSVAIERLNHRTPENAEKTIRSRDENLEGRSTDFSATPLYGVVSLSDYQTYNEKMDMRSDRVDLKRVSRKTRQAKQKYRLRKAGAQPRNAVTNNL